MGTKGKLLEEFNIIRTELDVLLRENEELPAHERLELRAFLLDEVGCQAALLTAEHHLAEERAAMEQQCLQQGHATQTVLHSCWQNMHVQGRCIKAIGPRLLTVRNFALSPSGPCAQAEMLEEVARHELVLSVTRLISFKPWQNMTDSELEQRLNASPLDRRSFRSVAEGVQRLLGELWHAQARVGGSNSPENAGGGGQDARERAVQSGSATHTLLTPEQSSALSLVMPFQQIELNISTHEASKHAFILNTIIRDLKELFNCEFNELWQGKEKELAKYEDIYERLREISKELNESCEDDFVLSTWDSSEKPELLNVEQDKDEAGTASCSEHSAHSAGSFCGRALLVMMDDRVDVRWQERLARDPSPPPCIMIKLASSWTEEERRSVESFEQHLAHVRFERESYRTQLLQERAQLRAALKDGSQRFDMTLARLSRRRLDFEAAVHQEELKVARIKLWSLKRAHMLQQERQLRQELEASDDKLARLGAQRLRLQVRCDAKRKHHETLLAHDRQQARGFRREFTQLSPMIVDQLAKIYRRRPAVQLSAAHLRFMSRKLGAPQHSASGEEVPLAHLMEHVQAPPIEPVSEPCRLYMATLRVMDAASNASPSVDTTAWSALCRLRRAKVEAEIRVKASALEVAEADAALGALDARLEIERRRQRDLTGHLEQALQQKRRLLLNTEVQLLMPRGQIELASVSSVSGCKEAIVVPLNTIRTLNRDIRENGARKLAVLRVGLRFRAGSIRQAEWEVCRAEAEVQLLAEELTHVEKITITAEIRQFLQGPQILRVAVGKKKFEQELCLRRVLDLEMEILMMQRQLRQIIAENNEFVKQVQNTESELTLLQESISTVHKYNHQRVLAVHSRLQRTIRSEGEQLQTLKQELEKMKLRTFPTLFDVSL